MLAKKRLTNLDTVRGRIPPSVRHQCPAPGYRQVSDARLKTALKRHDGILSQAAKAVGLSRQAVWERVQRNPELQRFIQELEAEVFDMVEGAIIDACREGDSAMLRFFADRRMRGRGYGPKSEENDKRDADPAAEEKRRVAFATMMNIIEERVKRGEPPIFAENTHPTIALPKQSNTSRRVLAGPPPPERW